MRILKKNVKRNSKRKKRGIKIVKNVAKGIVKNVVLWYHSFDFDKMRENGVFQSYLLFLYYFLYINNSERRFRNARSKYN